jgi:AcrR family transcriptional regulator
MGRRAQHAPDTLREMILKAAEDTVRDGGLGALSAREIARRIGYSPGTIYNMFANLDEVVLHVEARLLDRLAERMRAAKGRSPAEHVRSLTKAYVAFTHESPELWNLLFEHRLPADQDLPSWYMERLNRLMESLEMALAPFFAADADQSRTLAARALWAGVHGITSLSTSGKLAIVTTEGAQQLAGDLVDTYLRGLQAPEMRPRKRS